MNLDFNTLLSTALSAAVQQALTPLTGRIEQLERHRDELRDRLNNVMYGAEGGPRFTTVSEVDQQLEDIDQRIDRTCEAVTAVADRLAKVEERLGIFHADFGELEDNHARLWQRFNDHDDYLDTHGARLLKVEDRITKVENRVEREIAAGTAHEKLDHYSERLRDVEADIVGIEGRLKFRASPGADPVPLEDVIAHHIAVMAHLEQKIDEFGFDEDYLRCELIRPIVNNAIERAWDEFDFAEALEDSDTLTMLERKMRNLINDATITIEI